MQEPENAQTRNNMYKDTGIKEKVIEEIRALAKEYGLKRVVLFGSRTRGDYKERSDIDIAFRDNPIFFSVSLNSIDPYCIIGNV